MEFSRNSDNICYIDQIYCYSQNPTLKNLLEQLNKVIFYFIRVINLFIVNIRNSNEMWFCFFA